MSDNPFQARFILNPIYWPTWLGLGLLWLSTRLPFRVILALGSLLGALSLLLMSERRRIARINIGLCFPDLSKKEQRRLLRHSFYSSGMALFESALVWWGSEKKLAPLLHYEGGEHVIEAEKLGKGIIFLGGHYTSLEMSGLIMSINTSKMNPTYKKARNKLFNAVMVHSRKKIYDDLVKSLNMRDVVRKLKQSRYIWYAPDQDFGGKTSVFAPFMGIPASTLTMTSRLAKLTGAPVLPMYSERLPGTQGYKVTIGPPLKDFPSGDDIADATAINEVICQHIRRVPEQYLWGHRRFKSRPRGEPQTYAIRRDKTFRRYGHLLALLTLPAIVYTLWQALRFRDKQYLQERLGFGQYTFSDNSTWIHTASVGEVNAVIPLIKLLLARHPERSIVFTTNTPSGGQTARRKLPAQIKCHYLPIDWRFATRRFIHLARPACALIVETELWPHLFAECYLQGIPIVIINGRMSQRTSSASPWLRVFPCRAIEFIYTVLARSEDDKRQFLSMGGITEENIKVLGNIKFSARQPDNMEAFDCQRPYVLAASTRDGEELLIADCWQSIIEVDTLLIIVPRHPQRLSKILQDLDSYKQHIAVRSRNDVITDQTKIYVADTFGELNQFIAGSQFVLMGGSFKPFGGQNILEVGLLGKAVIFGPHMDNFKDEAQQFVENYAGIQVEDTKGLGAEIKNLLDDPAKAGEIGSNALQLMNKSAHIVEDYYTEIENLCAAFYKVPPSS